ncbi:MsnO8 family LLM class oxidoreductase [Virgibacillus sp. W0430]|uniref:MsnO8 family LLM class oxidoreductase n=1 Tax=Virgibacillus sp. W0430 TaxID=3391580 RepID=UPI003F482F4C
MKLSILDQSPIPKGKTAYDALRTSVKLAQLGERYGYTRYWIAEHHDLFGLACPNPDVMLGIIGSQTTNIRIGAGAVLLPYYKPFRVAETYNLLATMFPDRIDLGLGRAPGGSAEASLALVENYLEQVGKFPQLIEELKQWLQHRYQNGKGTLLPTPIPIGPPQLWLLGTSEKSAVLAGEKGMAYAFGHFMSEKNGPEVVDKYRYIRTKKGEQKDAKVIVAVTVFCAATTEQANELALSNIAWSIKQETGGSTAGIPDLHEAKAYINTQSNEKVEMIKEKYVIGNPAEVEEQLRSIKTEYDADELMIVTITHDEQMKLRSYQLIAERLLV